MHLPKSNILMINLILFIRAYPMGEFFFDTCQEYCVYHPVEIIIKLKGNS